MSMALQQEVVALREQLTEARTQLSKLSAQFVVEQSKRADLAARVGQLEDALAGIQVANAQKKESQHGSSRAKVRA